MKAVIVSERPVLGRRIAQLLERHAFEVVDASLHDGVIDLLAQETFDLMLIVAPEDEAAAMDLIQASKEVRPSLLIYMLARDGELTQLIPRLQPALGKKIGINDIPLALQEDIARADAEREHFRLEWLKHVEDMVTTVGAAATVREAAKKLVEQIQVVFSCRCSAVVLLMDAKREPDAVATAGDIDKLSNVWKESSAIFQWLSENQTPLLIRRGRAAIPGIQRDVVKFGLGPTMFVPIATSQRMVGFLVAERAPEAEPLSESVFSVMRIAARALSLRMESEQATAADELRQILQHEREWRQSLEDKLTGEREALRRLAREIANLVEIKTGQRTGRSELIARLSVALAEQMDLDVEGLAEAIYLRDIGMLGLTEASLPGMREATYDLAKMERDHTIASFEILSRVRMPSVCLEVARHHHENYDGSGSPDGLKGDDIPTTARIVRLVESYVTMTNPNDGELPAPSPVALGQLAREAGRSYDPNMTNTSLRIIRAQGVTPEQETLSVIAHELRTPLTFLMGFSELLAARQDLPGQAKEMAAELHKQTEQMVVLTERLLELSRLQAGRISLSWQWVDLRELVVEQVNKSKALTQRHTLRVDAPPYSVRNRVDATRVTQAVNNLITNAIKYSPQGGDILVKLEERVSEVVITVRDQGVGIPKDKLSRLFQPFYRVQQAETQQVEGLGLGLAVTRAIVEAHGGKIWAESEVGKGSLFGFSVPKQEAGGRSPTENDATSPRQEVEVGRSLSERTTEAR